MDGEVGMLFIPRDQRYESIVPPLSDAGIGNICGFRQPQKTI